MITLVLAATLFVSTPCTLDPRSTDNVGLIETHGAERCTVHFAYPWGRSHAKYSTYDCMGYAPIEGRRIVTENKRRQQITFLGSNAKSIQYVCAGQIEEEEELKD